MGEDLDYALRFTVRVKVRGSAPIAPRESAHTFKLSFTLIKSVPLYAIYTMHVAYATVSLYIANWECFGQVFGDSSITTHLVLLCCYCLLFNSF